MLQWLEYRSTHEYVKGAYPHSDSMRVHYDREGDIVIFQHSKQAVFGREEAIDMLKDILKTLEDE